MMCLEQENQPLEGTAQQQGVSESYQLMQQQLKETNDTISTLLQQLTLTQQSSQLLIIHTCR